MANKITGQLIDVSPFEGDELVHVEQDGNSRKMSLDEIAAYCSAGSIFDVIQATGTGVPQNITLPFSGLTENDVSVFVNGIRYETSEYSISGATLTVTSNASGDTIEVLSRGSGNSSNVIWSKRPTVKEITGTSYDLLAVDDGKYLRFTNAAGKTVTVRNNATEALLADSEWYIRNIGAGAITLVEDSSVNINVPYGGSLILEQGMMATLKRVGINEFDLNGQTSAP